MRRVKETVFFLALILLLGAFYLRATNSYFTPEQVLRANEIGLHYGPSEKVLLCQPGEERSVLVIGWLEEGALSVIPAQRGFTGLWKLKSGGVPGYQPIREGDRGTGSYANGYDLVYGLTDFPGTATVTCTVQYKTNELPDFLALATLELPVDENGFFAASYHSDRPAEENGWYYISDLTGYDAAGNPLWQSQSWF